MFAGDIIGVVAGSLWRGPIGFTADSDAAERSLRRVVGLDFDRILFGHGSEIEDPLDELATFLSASFERVERGAEIPIEGRDDWPAAARRLA